jgi:L-alanine-DL-glutamate epimerase-like enolase superfamily enzyme
VKISQIETIPLLVPVREDRMIQGSRGAHAVSPFAVVVIRTDEGLEGLGEVSCTPRWSGEDAWTAAHVVDRYVAPWLVGQDPLRIHAITAEMGERLHGHHFTKAGIEMALWDLLGKSAGLPVHQLLGGPTKDEIRTKFSIGGGSPERVGELAAWAASAGFEVMKVKVGSRDGTDLRRYLAAREAVGDAVAIGVDANGGWDFPTARRIAAQLVDHGVAFVEQPLPPADAQGAAELRRQLGVPLVADDAIGTPEQAAAVVDAGAADVLSLYVGMAGGIAPARRIAELAVAHGLGWMIGSNLELGIGMAAHTHVAASVPGLADGYIPCDIISSFYYEADVVSGLEVRPGRVTVPTAPGLGVELDLEVVERYRVDRA